MIEHLYLLGHPISHSKSPDMYNALYGRLQLPWCYELADYSTEEEARSFLASREFLSVNITTPYKPLAYEMATAKAASAKLARGANLLVKKGDVLIAYNTDGQGCVSYLERVGFDFSGKHVVVCGTGPTALAIMHACAIAGVDEIVLLGRDGARSRNVLDTYGDEFDLLAQAAVDLPPEQDNHRSFREANGSVSFLSGSYSMSTADISAADLVVNATPLGMNEGDPAPFDTALLHGGQVVFDAVYGHGETALVQAAREAGCTVYDGAGMLVAQAVATVRTLMDIEGMMVHMTTDELFDVMSDAAGFSIP